MENNEKLFIQVIINILDAEFKNSKRVSKAIRWIHEEVVALADNSGMTLEEYKQSKLKIN